MSLGAASALLGGIGFLLGGRNLWRFFSDPPQPPWTLSMFARSAIVPHILLLMGLGMLVFGAILMIKSVLVEKRIRAEASQRSAAPRNA